MTTNKKIIITFSSICAVLVIALVAVIAVFAATQGSVSSNITVHYTATDIAAKVSANVINASGDSTAMTVDGESTGATTITIDSTSTNATVTGTLKPTGTIELSSSSQYVVFEFVFENDSTSYYLNVNSESGYPNSTGSSSNFVVTYYSGTQIIDGNYSGTITGETFSTLTVAGNSTGYVYIMVKIQNTADSSTMYLNFSWVLTQGDSYSA